MAGEIIRISSSWLSTFSVFRSMRRSFLLSAHLPVVLLAIGAVLLAAAWIAFDFEPALAVLVLTLTAASAATVARLALTDDAS